MDKSLHEFGREMSHLLPAFIQEVLKRQAKAFSKEDITISQMIILSLLMEKGRLMMSGIAKALSVTTSAATGLVSRMVASKLVRRATHKKDRRIINIEITNKGRRAIEDIQRRRHKMMMEMFCKLTTHERNIYLGIVKKLYRILTEGRK